MGRKPSQLGVLAGALGKPAPTGPQPWVLTEPVSAAVSASALREPALLLTAAVSGVATVCETWPKTGDEGWDAGGEEACVAVGQAAAGEGSLSCLKSLPPSILLNEAQ